MAKFHINPETGNPGTCTAKTKCPYGDLEADHYPTPEIARATYEVKMKTKELEVLQKDYQKSTGVSTNRLSDQHIASIKHGSFNTKSASFRKDYVGGAGEERWHGKITGEPDDVDILVTFTKRSVISSLSWDRKSLLVDSIPLENARDLSESDKGNFLLKMTKAAKTKHGDKLAENREEVLARGREFNRGKIHLNKSPMTYVPNEPDSYGETREGSLWEGEKRSDGWKTEISVERGIAQVTIRNAKEGRFTPVHSERLKDGYNTFVTGAEAARFLIKADKRLSKLPGFSE